jgi:hypothetical protein
VGCLLYGRVIWNWGKVCCLIERDGRSCRFLQRNQPNQADRFVSRTLGRPRPRARPPPRPPQLPWPPHFGCDADGLLGPAVQFLLVASSVFLAHNHLSFNIRVIYTYQPFVRMFKGRKEGRATPYKFVNSCWAHG